MVGCDQHHVTEEDSCPASVSETFTKEEAVVPSEATLMRSVRTNSSDDSVEKEEGLSAIDNSTDTLGQMKEITANSDDDTNDDTVKKEEDITKKKVLNTEDVPESTTLKTFEKNNLIVNQPKVCTVHACVFEIRIKEVIINLF